MAVILNNKKSTNGSPYAFYTVETTNITNRTQTTVDISFKITVNLQYSESLSGTGRPLTGGLYLVDGWQTFTIKNSSTSWSGTAKHYINVTFTISNLTASQTSITGVQFRSVGSSSYGGTLSATACSDIEIPSGHKPPTISIQNIEEKNNDLISAGVPDNTFVTYLSKKKFTLKSSTYDGTTPLLYKVKWGNTYVQDISTSTQTSITIDFKNSKVPITDGKVVFRASVIDSMASETESQPYEYTAILYEKPTIAGSSSVKRNGQTSGLAYLNISGTYFDGEIGNVTNDITIRYRYYEVGSSSATDHYISSASITKSDGTFTVTNYEIGSSTPTDPNYFDYLKQYVVEIYVDDAFNTASSEKRINKGVPVWTEYSDRVSFEKLESKDTDINGALDVVGSITLNGSPIGSKNILKASLHSDYSITSVGNKKMTMADIDFQQGSALSISDGGIKIGAGITKVKVSGSIYFSGSTNAGDSLRATIFKNNTNTTIAFNYARAGTTGTYETRNVVPVPITVQENDIIYLYGNNATGGGRGTIAGGETNTYLIVEEI